MKKSLLFLGAVALAAVSANAQTEKMAVRQMMTYPSAKQMAVKVSGMKKAIKRTAEDGVYYTKPVGTYYNSLYGYDVETKEPTAYPTYGYSYKYSLLTVPAWTMFTFENACTNPSSAQWSLNTYDHSTLQSYGMIDDNNNFVWEISNPEGATMYLPTITSGSLSYTLGETNTTGAVLQSQTDLSFLGLNDYSIMKMYSGWKDGGYIFGTGNIEMSDGTYPTVGLMQYFPQPASPLYVERFNLTVLSNTSFFTNDNKLTLTLYNVVEGADGPEMGEKVLYTATAGKDNVHNDKSDGGKHFATLDFSNVDEENEVAPVVLNEPFYAVVTGFNQDGVDVGVSGSNLDADPSSADEQATSIMVDNNGNLNFVSYKSRLSMGLTMRGIFDLVEPYSTSNGFSEINYNIVRVSDDGKTISTEGAGDKAVNFVPVATARPWTDATTGDDNYYWAPTDDNEWVTGITVDDSYVDKNGFYALQFNCEKLPAGVSGRKAVVELQGLGYKATPIILLQGDATAGIDGVDISSAAKSNSSMFNLAGQRVGKNYKGIVVKDGKKILK